MSETADAAAAPSALDRYAGELNTLESRALGYLRSRDDSASEPPLTDDDRAALTRIRNRAVMWAAISGTVSGLIIGGVETYIRLVVIGGDGDRGLLDDPGIWSAFYVGVGALTIIEIGFLYWVALSAIARMRAIVGVAIKQDNISELVKTGLARSALEVPNPHQRIFGVDPYMLMPRWRLLTWNLLYKAKVGATSILMRVFMRRVLSRAVLRGYIPLLAVPLYAGWNAFILWRVMQEARLRALGPFAVKEATGLLVTDGADKNLSLTALHGAAEMVSRSSDAHPNYVLLLSQLIEQSGFDKAEIQSETDRLWAEIDRLGAADRRRLVHFVMIVAVLAGRPNRAQIQFAADVHARAGLAFDAARLAQLRKRLLDGRSLGDEPLASS